MDTATIRLLTGYTVKSRRYGFQFLQSGCLVQLRAVARLGYFQHEMDLDGSEPRTDHRLKRGFVTARVTHNPAGMAAHEAR